MTCVCVRAEVPLPVHRAFAHFWSLESLREGWPAITEVRLIYDDGVHQEAQMLVERDGATEHIRVIRVRKGTDIEIFTPEPPPMMTWHRGAWRFRTAKEGSLIIAEREYDLLRREGEGEIAYLERESAFKDAFEARLGRILASVGRGGEPCGSSTSA